MNRISRRLLALAFAGASASGAQTVHRSIRPLDATWAKVYATDCGSAEKHTCPPSDDGYENEFNGDPRLPELLRRALPQRESWWVNGRAGSTPVSSIVQEFIGVPKELSLDDDRYVTASGCVPHDCTTHGMLWIDTGSVPAVVVFAATDDIQDFTSSTVHLWLYGSETLNFEALPHDFLISLDRWHTSIINPKYDPQHITVATLVQPNGRMRDLTYDMLFYKQRAPQFHTTGVKQ